MQINTPRSNVVSSIVPPPPLVVDLKLGSRGPQVLAAQRMLTRAGFPVPLNGIFDKRMLAAVRGYQLSRQIPVTGEIRNNTWMALQRNAPPRPLKLGAAGPAVRDLQKMLNENGVLTRTSGKFDAQTLAAVKDFQRTHGLKVDGIVGPQTARALAAHARIILPPPPPPPLPL